MKTPIWLLKPAILAMHAECIATHGGSDGLRDEGLLDSALARPVHLHHYEKANLWRLAAAYAVGIAKNHPFVDGNKRTAFLAAAVFLERNGLILTADPGAAAVFVIGVAASEIDEAGFAAWLEDHTKQRRRRVTRTRKKPPRK
jgi:death on curing protein